MTIGAVDRTVPPRRFSPEERRGFAARSLTKPLAAFVGLTFLYGLTLFVTLAAPFSLALGLSVLGGILIGQIFIIGHDASHNSFTASTRLNRVIARLAFLPSLHSASLWDLAHNRTHHRFNNLRGWDYVWEPMTEEDYRSAGRIRRALYRFYRMPLGVPFYYLIEIWAPRLFLPFGKGRGYWFDSGLVLLFLAAQVCGTIAVGGAMGHSPAMSLLLGFVIPFLIWNGFMSLVIFLHHTHPLVPWYETAAAWENDQGAIHGTAHVRFPWPADALVLSIMEHNGHHHASGVPLYHLPRMQAALAQQGDVVSWKFSLRAYARVCQRCKLYDYRGQRWVPFGQS